MRKTAFALAALLALLPLAVPAAKASMLVPAVITDGEGEMVRAEVKIEPGTGNIYISTEPLVGMDTQFSERTAVRVAAERLGRDARKYDVFLTLRVNDTKEVDGPSAGAAMTLLAIAALNGTEVRNDVTITGTIMEDGRIGSVGGVSKKAEAAARSGLSILMVPRETDAFEKIMLAALRRRLNISIVEVGTIEEAEAIAFSPAGSEPPAVAPSGPAPLADIVPARYDCEGCGLEEFGAIAKEFVADSKRLVDSIPANDSNYAEILPILRKDAADSELLEKRGYHYTAANTAFLNRINALLLLNSSMNRRDLALFIDSAEGCVSSLDRGELTDENIDWRTGADLRATWAEKKLDEVRGRELKITGSEDMLFTYREALFAWSWCEAADRMYAVSRKRGGNAKDEGVLRGLASLKISEARRVLDEWPERDSDAEWHLGAAELAYNRSRYAAAIYDADYVLGAISAKNVSGSGLKQRAEEYAGRRGGTLWSALFYAHAGYYKEVDASPMIVVRLGSIAERLEEDSGRMAELLENPEAAPIPVEISQPLPAVREDVEKLNESLVVLVVLLSVLLITSAVLNIIVFTRMKRKLSETSREVARRERAK